MHRGMRGFGVPSRDARARLSNENAEIARCTVRLEPRKCRSLLTRTFSLHVPLLSPLSRLINIIEEILVREG